MHEIDVKPTLYLSLETVSTCALSYSVCMCSEWLWLSMTLFQMGLTSAMQVLILVVLMSSLQQVHGQSNDSRIPLYFSYITTKTGDYVGAGAIPAVDLALEQINNSSSILPNYTLEYTDILDSNVSSILRA